MICFLWHPAPVVCSEAPMVGEHLKVIVDFLEFTVKPVLNLRDEALCPPPLLRCVPLLLPSLEAILPHDLLLFLLFS